VRKNVRNGNLVIVVGKPAITRVIVIRRVAPNPHHYYLQHNQTSHVLTMKAFVLIILKTSKSPVQSGNKKNVRKKRNKGG